MSSKIIDIISIKRINNCHPATIIKLHQWLVNCSIQNIGVRIVQGIRSYKYQDELYAQGRTKPGKIVTKAKGGESWHNFGCAFDFGLLHEGRFVSWDMREDLNHDGISDWLECVDIAKELGFEWGGDWEEPDYPHFQMTFGLSRQEARRRYESGLCDKNGFIYINKEQ